MTEEVVKEKKVTKKIFFGGISRKDKIMFTQNLSIMLHAGLTISQALDILADQARGKFKPIVNKIMEMIMSGSPLWQALSRYPKIFSGFYVQTIKAGETSGNLEANLDRLSMQMLKDDELNSKIKNAMFYPMIILVLGIAIALIISFFVLPKITPIFMGLKVELPLSTRMLISFSAFIKDYGIIFIISLIAIFIFTGWLFKLKISKPFTHKIFLTVPILSALNHNRNLATFSRTLGTLLKSGLSIDEALTITQKSVPNYYYQKVVENIRRKISQGVRLSDCLEKEKGYFSKMTISMIKVGESSGSLDDQLFNLANIYEQEIDHAIKTLSTAIEPILLVIIGVAVGGLALSIITPIYKITGSISR